MLIAEDLLLLLTDDASGSLVVPGQQADAALGGANLVELVLLRKVDLSGTGDAGEPGRIIVRDTVPAGDSVLDAALQIALAHQGSKPSTLIRLLGKDLRRLLYARLAASGVVRAEQGRMVGFFPAHRWPAQDASHETQVREQLTGALLGRAAPEPRSAALIALLHAFRCEHKVVDPRHCALSRRQLRARAEQIAEGDWASAAVRQVIEETIAAVAAVAITAATAGAG